jgi:hypothetical protein
MKFNLICVYFMLLTNIAFGQVDKRLLGPRKNIEVKENLIELDSINTNKDDSELNSQSKKTRGETSLSTADSNVVEGEGVVAMNPSDNQNLACTYMSYKNSISTLSIYYTKDGGSSWLKSNFKADSVFYADCPSCDFIGCGDPVLTFDKTGVAHFTWLSFGETSVLDTGVSQLNAAFSIDGGATWQLATNHILGKSLSEPTLGILYPGYAYFDRQWMTTDLTNGPFANTVYCSYIFIQNTSNTGMYVKTKTAGSNTFDTSQQAVAIGSYQSGNIAVDKNGVLHYIYIDYDSNRIYHQSSSDGGVTFSAQHLIYTGTNLWGGYNYIYRRENSDPNIAIDSQNNLYVVWTDFPKASTNNYNAYLSKSTDGGLSWGLNMSLSNIFTANPKVMMPQVCASGNKISIGAYSISNTKVADYYLATSLDNGVTFPNNLLTKLSTSPTDFAAPINYYGSQWFGDYFNAVRNECFVYNIWSDGRGINKQKMYVAKTQECFPTSLTEINTLNAGFSIVAIYPQPAKENMIVKVLNDSANKIEVTITSTIGATLFSKQFITTKNISELNMDTHLLPSGNYLIHLSGDDGTRISKLISII